MLAEIGGIALSIALLIIGAILAQMVICTKSDNSFRAANRKIKQVDEKITEHIIKSANRNDVVLQSLVAIMTTLKKVDVDKEGKMDIALKNLNDYVINKGDYNGK